MRKLSDCKVNKSIQTHTELGFGPGLSPEATFLTSTSRKKKKTFVALCQPTMGDVRSGPSVSLWVETMLH